MAVPAAIVTSFIVILVVSLSPLVNKGLVNAFSDSVIPTPSTTSTTSESTADLVKSTEVSSIKENKEKVEESKAQSETMTETVGASEKPQSESATTASIDATFTQNNGAASSVAASTTGNGSVLISNGNTAGEIPQSTWESIIARESNGDYTVASSSGASGFFQIMPGWGSTATVEDQIQSALNAYNAQGLSAWNY